MRNHIVWLATAGFVSASPSVFSVHDDFLAFPQYEVVFSDTFISDHDARSQLAFAASAPAHPTTGGGASEDATSSPPQGPSAELSRPQGDGSQSASHHGDSRFPVENHPTDSYESMILDGKKYLCAIPLVEIPNKNDSSFVQAKAKAAEEEAAELARATDRGWELLQDMEGKCMYFISGWWSYSFCYNTDVKQFHQLPPGKSTPMFPPVEDESTPSYVLGKFDQPKNSKDQQIDGKRSSRSGDSHGITELQAKGETRYLVQRLGGGTTCDLTGRERRIEIQFHCHPQSADRIGWIKEVSTCSYLMVIYTPRLCHDVAFLPPLESKANPITCREVVADDDVPAWQSRKSFPSNRNLVDSGPSSSSNLVVAGIEVGAMHQVGKPGARLDPPTIVVQPNGAIDLSAMGGKGTLLAKQDKGGQEERLADVDLKQLGIDPKDVASASERLKDKANGNSWKLELYEGPDGTEIRAILQTDDGEGEAGYTDNSSKQKGAPAEGDDGEPEGYESGEAGSEEEFKDDL
ncbi:Protein OS-9 [Pseudocyphellaria aurata]|nr:Protein OS-9 [Pseudocyphellaria aurata]